MYLLCIILYPGSCLDLSNMVISKLIVFFDPRAMLLTGGSKVLARGTSVGNQRPGPNLEKKTTNRSSFVDVSRWCIQLHTSPLTCWCIQISHFFQRLSQDVTHVSSIPLELFHFCWDVLVPLGSISSHPSLYGDSPFSVYLDITETHRLGWTLPTSQHKGARYKWSPQE